MIPFELLVVIDCASLLDLDLKGPDATAPNGFRIGDSRGPAHLMLSTARQSFELTMQISLSEQQLNVQSRVLKSSKPYIHATASFGMRVRSALAFLTIHTCLIVACGAKTSDSNGSPAVATSQGGANNGGTGGLVISSTTSTSDGGSALGTGGIPSLADGCNGTWQGHVCGMNTIQVDVGIDAAAANTGSRCDLSLKSTPSVPQDRLLVLIDCVPQPVVPVDTLDASIANGFSMDYKPIPAHLLFHGTSCDIMEAPETHIVDVIVGCGCCD